MRVVSPIDLGATLRHATGWMASLLAHGAAVGIAVFLVTGTRPTPPEPFQWNVSILEPAPAPEVHAAAQTAAPPSPAPAQSAAPAEPAPAPLRMTETPAAAQPQPPQAAPAPSEPAPPRPAPAEESLPVIARATPPAPPSPAAQEPVATVSKAPPPIEPAAAAPAAPHTPAPSSPAASAPSAKRDYGWLAETLWGRIEQLKRYPAVARLNHWEGKVVLRAVIKEDGRVVDLRIAQSSGHDVLDQDALGLMQQASPIPLKQPLGNPQVVVHIPISYKLEQ